MVPSSNLICGFYEGRDRNKEQKLEELVRDMLLALNKYEDVEPYLAHFLEVVNYAH